MSTTESSTPEQGTQSEEDPDRFRKGCNGCAVICPLCGVDYCCLPAQPVHDDHRCDRCD
jgi:hypothetical protein